MDSSRLYLSLLIFVREGEEQTFQAYEDQVLPLLAQYGGELHYRVRPERAQWIQTSGETPYEIHVLSFGSREDFQRFRADETRRAAAPLFAKSVFRTVLLEGRLG